MSVEILSAAAAATAGTSCLKNPQQTEVMELRGYSRPTCSKQPRRVDRRRCRQQARPSTSSVDNTVELPRRNFTCAEFRTKFHGEVPLFLEQREIPYSIV